MDAKSVERRVRKGAKLLDKNVPGWRRIIRQHKDKYDFTQPECCVLGTLEHFSGVFKSLRARGIDSYSAWDRAKERLGGIRPGEYGFDWGEEDDIDAEKAALIKLWEKEIAKGA